MINQSGLRVSVLEEQPVLQAGLSRFLAQAEINVLGPFSDIQSFFDSLETNPTEVALIDVELRRRDGMDVLREARKSFPRTRVVALAGHDPSALARCISAGASGYLERSSVTSEGLSECLHAAARGLCLFPQSSGDAPRAAPGEDVLSKLSERERQVLGFVASGADNLKIAAHLGIAERTVKAHVSALYRKLGQDNRTQVALLALRLGVEATDA